MPYVSRQKTPVFDRNISPGMGLHDLVSSLCLAKYDVSVQGFVQLDMASPETCCQHLTVTFSPGLSARKPIANHINYFDYGINDGNQQMPQEAGYLNDKHQRGHN